MGATNNGRTFVARSASDLSSYNYRFVKDSTGSTAEDRIVELCGSGDTPCGILEVGDVAGRKMEIVRLNGQNTRLTVGGIVALGSLLKCDTAATEGKGIATTTDGNRYFAVADEITTANGNTAAVYTCNAFRGA